MYHNLLDAIRKRAKLYEELLQPPCSPESLSNVRHRAKETLGCDIVDAYADFLAIANGLDWNGLVVFASERTPILGYSDRFIEGFVEANLYYRESDVMKAFLIYADDGDALYTYCTSKGEFQVVTSVGLTVLETCSTFDELLANALEAHL